ncbi:hypothetical protein GCM10022240_31630 [Microbacterium kribbense]|uniref:Uncharacterized protein n=1 Tax=Microbacterium kribbense TaxID=433645 RepID=A0ABP7H4B1_9MICO
MSKQAETAPAAVAKGAETAVEKKAEQPSVAPVVDRGLVAQLVCL